MNRIYRLVWSQVRNAWVAASENAKGQGKPGRGKSSLRRNVLVTALSVAFAPMVQAGPGGGQLVSGSGSISQSGAVTTINQFSNTLSLNWQNFNIAPQETVNFLQPSAAAIAINRILDTNGSQILGQINANGQVWLINPNGVLFGQGAQVNVGGLVASTLGLNNADSPSGSYTFGTLLPQAGEGLGRGAVINQGTINAAQGGYIALLGNQVNNQGTLTAPLGTVALGAGSATTLTFAGNSLVQLQVEQSTLNNLAENGGLIQADGGRVILSAGAKDAVLASVVNNTGIIEARTVENHAGTITLLGGMTAGTVNVGGTLDASAPTDGNGGFIETSAAHVEVANTAIVTTAAQNGLTGTWLIDPDGFTIAANGGDISGATLSANLNNGDVVIDSTQGQGTDGNINVNDAVSWSNNQLSLNATNNINVNAMMSANNARLLFTAGNDVNINAVIKANHSSLDLEPVNTLNFGMNETGFGGRVDFFQADGITPRSGSGFLTINNTDYTVISDLGTVADITSGVATLQGLGAIDNLSGTFALGVSLDAHSVEFSPVGDIDNMFSGTFEGLGHSLSNISIHRPSSDNVGLFGVVDTGAIINNIALTNSSVIGANNVGGLVGYNSGTVNNSYVSGSVSGSRNNLGGLVGYNTDTVSNSYAANSVTSLSAVLGTSNNLGGLVGNNEGSITNSHASGNVLGTASNNLGGLVGYDYGVEITSSYATGNVNGNYYLGGLVGYANYSTISQTFASGTVTGNRYVGGLVGYNYGGTIDTSYARSAVNGTTFVGGLVGYNYGGGTLENCYAVGKVTGTASVGGLIGHNPPATISVTNSFWDTTTTGLGGSGGGGVGMTTLQMQTLANFNSATQANHRVNPEWDLTDTWILYEGNTYPLLRSFMTPLTVTANNTSKTYDGNSYNGSGGATYSLTPDNNLLLGTLSYTGGPDGIVNAGTHTITPAGLYSPDQLGYAITFVEGTLTVNRAPLTAFIIGSPSKIYDGTTNVTLQPGDFGVTGFAAGEGVIVGEPTGTFNSPNVLAANTISSTLTAGYFTANEGTLLSNYDLPTSASGDGSITPAPLVATVIGVPGKVYDGSRTLTFTPTNINLSGFIEGEGAAVVNMPGTFTGTFNSINVIDANSVTTTFAPSYVSANTGTILANYTVPLSASGTAHITPAPLTVTGLTAASKVYDKTTAASLTGGTLNGLIPADISEVTIAPGGIFATPNAGNNIAVTASLSGSSTTNYSLIQPDHLVANITPRSLSVAGEVASNKIYDGKAAATLSGGLLSGVLSGDTVTLLESGLFASKDVGNAIAVTPTSHLGGASASNYTVIQPETLSANITPAPLVATVIGVPGKVYDGTSTLPLTPANINLSGFVEGEGAAIVNMPGTFTGTFNSKNVIDANSVTATFAPSYVSANTGTLLTNYTLPVSASGTIHITPAPLTVTGLTAAGKVYDKTTAASLTGGTLQGVISADLANVQIAPGGNFTTPNVGDAIAVNPVLVGDASGNYLLTRPANLVANITPKSLSVAGEIAVTKIYDGTTDAALTAGQLNGVIEGDTVTFNPSGTFASKDVGNAIAVTPTSTLGGISASNYRLIQPENLSANITPVTLVATFVGVLGKVYDGTSNLPLTPVHIRLDGFIEGEGAGVRNISGTVNSKNVLDANSVTATFAPTDFLADMGTLLTNYTLPLSASGAAHITRAPVVATVIGVSGKVYDGGSTLTLTPANINLSGFFEGEGAAVVNMPGTFTGTFNSKNVIDANSITTTFAPSYVSANTGTLLTNYTLPVSASGTGHITPAPLTVTGLTTASKVYDKTTAASLTGGTLQGVISADLANVQIAPGGNFTTPNVGDVITVNPALVGDASGNYLLTRPANLVANITPLSLSVTGETAANKIYDGTTDATLGGGQLHGVISGDSVTLIESGQFASKDVGNAITITPGNTLGGDSAANYTLIQPTGFAANITPRAITVSGLSADNKIYDGTTAATLSGGTLTGVISADTSSVSLNNSGLFSSKNVGDHLVVTIAIGGSLSTNYMLTQPDNLFANITPRPISVTGETAANTIYSGTREASLSGGQLNGVLTGESVTLIESGLFASKDVGNAIAVTPNSTLGGNSAANYTLIQPVGLTANITPLSLSVTGETAANKIYDGTTNATLDGGQLHGVISGDSVTLIESGQFASKDVGNAIAITPGNTLGGDSAANYTLIQPTGFAANITPLALTVSGLSAANKIYDGTTAATLSGGVLNGVIAADTLTVALNPIATFASKNVADSIAVTPTLSGASASNYTLTRPADLLADITPLTLSIAHTQVLDKVYDGNMSASVSGSILNGILPSDSASLALVQSGLFDTKNIGNAIPVTITNSLTGTAAGNYQVAGSLSLAANITPVALGATIAGSPSKIYDGTTLATLTPKNFRLSGFITGEGATVGKTTGSYNSQNVLTATTVSTPLAATDFTAAEGTLLSNYTLPANASGAGSITPAGQKIVVDAALQMANRFVLSGTPNMTSNLGSFVQTPSSLYSSLYYTTSYNNAVLTIVPSVTQGDPNSGVYEVWYGIVRSYMPRLLQR